MAQAQRTRPISSGQRLQNHDELVGDISTNARHVGTAPPLLSAQSLHPCDGVADPTRPSGRHSVPAALSTSTSEAQPTGMVDHSTTLTPKAIQATNKPRGRKREEDSDSDALPTKRTKTDHASGNSDDHDRSENKNGAPLGSPVQNDDHIAVPTSRHAESKFNRDTNHANKDTNKPVSIPPRDLIQEILDGTLPEEAEAAIAASKLHDGPDRNSLGAWQAQEAEAETESQQWEPSLSINKQPEGSHVQQDSVVGSSRETTAPPGIGNNNDQDQKEKALEALKCLQDPKIQEYLVAYQGKLALQVSRDLAGKKFAKDTANKHDPRRGWIHNAHQSRKAGASESGLVIEFDMIVPRGDPNAPDPDSTKWAPVPDGSNSMSKKTIGLVTTTDEEFKNVKVLRPKATRTFRPSANQANSSTTPRSSEVHKNKG